MKGILQYANTDSGPYKDCGTVRSRRNQDFKIRKLTEKDRLGQPQTIGYEVRVQALALELNTDFLNSSQWYFRIIYPEELEMIKLGQRTYMVDHDGLITRNEIVYHTIQLTFIITSAEYGDYADPVPLPPEEGGVVIEDSAIYIE